MNCPYHEIWNDTYTGAGATMVVHTDGACRRNGFPDAEAGIGVYFGPDSVYNVSRRLGLHASVVATSQKAELGAIIEALQVVRDDIVPRLDHSDEGKAFRLLVVTDSSYAVECLCEHVTGWSEVTELGQNTLTTRDGRIVLNSHEFLQIKEEVERLSEVGVQVMYWHVPREFNTEADERARAALR